MFSRRGHAVFVISPFSTVFAAWPRRLNGRCFDTALSATETKKSAAWRGVSKMSCPYCKGKKCTGKCKKDKKKRKRKKNGKKKNK